MRNVRVCQICERTAHVGGNCHRACHENVVSANLGAHLNAPNRLAKTPWNKLPHMAVEQLTRPLSREARLLSDRARRTRQKLPTVPKMAESIVQGHARYIARALACPTRAINSVRAFVERKAGAGTNASCFFEEHTGSAEARGHASAH